MFDIAFSNELPRNPRIRWGNIRIGEFSELFEFSTEFWQAADYERHWRESVFRLINDDSDSCLITSITDPATANFLFWWPLFKLDSNTVAIQNQVLFFDCLEKEFDAKRPHLSLGPRQTINEDGYPISEWKISIDELKSWLS